MSEVKLGEKGLAQVLQRGVRIPVQIHLTLKPKCLTENSSSDPMPLLTWGVQSLLDYSYLQVFFIFKSLCNCISKICLLNTHTHTNWNMKEVDLGDGTPLQCSCLENPMDGGAWWAAVYGVTQSQTWLNQLSSSSSRPRRRQTFHSFLCSSCSWFPSPPWRQLIIANSSVAFHIFFSTDSNLCSLKNSLCFEFVLIT